MTSKQERCQFPIHNDFFEMPFPKLWNSQHRISKITAQKWKQKQEERRICWFAPIVNTSIIFGSIELFFLPLTKLLLKTRGNRRANNRNHLLKEE
ncbi:Phthiodiolone/phenolphthiodiolone dimycocerosates ketoreductase [Dirofilaria immitis]